MCVLESMGVMHIEVGMMNLVSNRLLTLVDRW
jgi:hypothetical protein